MADRRTKNIAELIGDVDATTKIARFLYENNLSLSEVDLKSKFTELFGLLTEIKMELSEFQEIVSAKSQKIFELEDALKFKGKLVCIGDAYYETDDKGKPTGYANCVKCWENTYKKRKLIVKPDDPLMKICPTCNQVYSRIETDNIKKKFKLFG